MRQIYRVMLGLGILVLGACEKETSSDNHFIYFSITEPYQRIGGVEFTIDNRTGTIQNVDSLPAGTDLTALKAFFVTNHDNDAVYIHGTKQVSGVTVNDFSSPVTYRVEASGQKREYTVNLKVSEARQSQAGVKLQNLTGFIKGVVADRAEWLHEAVRLSEVQFIDKADRALTFYLFEVDLTNPEVAIRATTASNQPNQWATKTMLDQALMLEGGASRVLGAVNGDYFDSLTGAPESILYVDGNVLKSSFDIPNNNSGFFAMRTDGKAAIGSYENYPIVMDKLQQAVGGRERIMLDGGISPGLGGSLDHRTAVATSLDLKTLYLAVIEDSSPVAVGVSLADMGSCLRAMGAAHALNLGGGAASSFVARQNDNLLALNRPADGLIGVSNGIAIIIKN